MKNLLKIPTSKDIHEVDSKNDTGRDASIKFKQGLQREKKEKSKLLMNFVSSLYTENMKAYEAIYGLTKAQGFKSKAEKIMQERE